MEVYSKSLTTSNRSPSLRLYAAVGSAEEDFSIIRRYVCNETLGFLLSFATFSAETAKRLEGVLGIHAMADCGAFTARTADPFLFLRESKSLENMAAFYNEKTFSLLVEPDVILPHKDFCINLAALRLRELQRLMPRETLMKMIRPLHGTCAREKIAFYDSMQSLTGYAPKYCALGGLDPESLDVDDFESAARQLAERGVRRLHLFSITSTQGIALAARLLRHFDHVSLDGSTWKQAAVYGRMALLFEGATGAMREVKFKAGKNRPGEDDLARLHGCPCPVCTVVTMKGENGRRRNLVDLGLASQQGHEHLSDVFAKKAALHNLYQQRMQLEYVNARIRQCEI